MSIPIYITSFFRKEFTLKTVDLIHERTEKGTFQLHIYDNGSDKDTRDTLYKLLEGGKITSLTLDSRNTGCLYDKLVFNSMTETSSKYMCITDNDVLPPKLTPDWLSQMIALMDKYPKIALLTPQLPPIGLQMPYSMNDEIVLCAAVGNTFKLCRTEAMAKIMPKVEQKLGVYGDDGKVSELLTKEGYKVAFCRKVFCYHAGQCLNWGYRKEDINKDPRKVGYKEYFKYNLVNEETYEPEKKWKL